jgi:hypothetical protein
MPPEYLEVNSIMETREFVTWTSKGYIYTVSDEVIKSYESCKFLEEDGDASISAGT